MIIKILSKNKKVYFYWAIMTNRFSLICVIHMCENYFSKNKQRYVETWFKFAKFEVSKIETFKDY